MHTCNIKAYIMPNFMKPKHIHSENFNPNQNPKQRQINQTILQQAQ